MRNCLFSVLLLMLFSIANVSCVNDELQNDFSDVADVVFDIDLETTSLTRAISDGTGATELMYGVFDEDNNVIFKKAVKNGITSLLTSTGYTMTISLPKGNTYRVVFWAQNPACTAYEVSDEMVVTINYDGINNDESRDAFFAVTNPFKVTSKTKVSAVLRRPFAQINVGTYPYDMQFAQDAGIDITKSSAVIDSVPSVINLLDGSLSGETKVTYSLSAIPAEQLMADVDENDVFETYTYLSMSYILAPAEGGYYDMDFAFTNEAEDKSLTYEGLVDVLAIRNWRTNIIGQIMTGNAQIIINVAPAYEGETLNSAGLYYNFSEDTEIKDRVFAFNTDQDVTFTTENNNLITMENVTFSGRVQYIAMGEYRDKGNYVAFRNEMTNVKAVDMVVDHPGIENVKAIDYMAPLVFLRGVSVLNDCVFTGTTTTAQPFADNYGDIRTPLPYDCGVPNDCEATFNDCVVDRLYAWSHSKITLNNSTLKYIRCSTHHNSKADAHMTIGAGTQVDELFISSSGLAKRVKDANGQYHWVDDPVNRWAPSLIIKAGATVKLIDMNNRPWYDKNGVLSVIIEDGANVAEIINALEPYPGN